jgi:hypothetical protein
MRMIEDHIPVPNRKVAFVLEGEEATDLEVTCLGRSSTFRARLVRVQFAGAPQRLIDVYVSGPRLTSRGKEHATVTDAWSWHSYMRSSWPPEDAPACALAAVEACGGPEPLSTVDEGWSALPPDVRNALVWWFGEDSPVSVQDVRSDTPQLLALVDYVQRHMESAAMQELALELGQVTDAIASTEGEGT